MKLARTSFHKHKKIILFLFIIFLFGIISGVLFYYKQDAGVRKVIITNLGNVFGSKVFDIKNIIYHLIFFAFLFISIFLFLGIPLALILIFVEGIALGFIIPIIFYIYKIKAILYFIVYFLFIKLLYLSLLYLIFICICKFSENYFSYFKTNKITFLRDLKRIIILGGFILINDLVVYFGLNKILVFLLG